MCRFWYPGHQQGSKPFEEFLFVLISHHYYSKFQFLVDSAKHKKCFSYVNDKPTVLFAIQKAHTNMYIVFHNFKM